MNFSKVIWIIMIVRIWRHSPQWTSASSFTRFLDHTQRNNTVGRTPLDEWSACHRDLYLTTHYIHTRTHNLSRRAATGLCLRRRRYWDRLWVLLLLLLLLILVWITVIMYTVPH